LQTLFSVNLVKDTWKFHHIYENSWGNNSEKAIILKNLSKMNLK